MKELSRLMKYLHDTEHRKLTMAIKPNQKMMKLQILIMLLGLIPEEVSPDFGYLCVAQ